MTAPPPPSPRAWLAALVFLDIALYLDMTLRWEAGFGFLRGSWLGVSFIWLAAAASVASLLLCWRAPGWLHAALAFVGLSVGFLLSSTGNAAFHWRVVPVFSHVMLETGLDFHWAMEGGLATGVCGAISHGILGSNYRRAATSPSPLALGLALVVASAVGVIDPVPLFVDTVMPDGNIRMVDPRVVSTAVPTLRLVFWLATLGVGLVLAGARISRGWFEPKPY